MSSSSDEAFIEGVLRALRRARLEALVVGSMAAALQGVPLTTQDLDLLIRDTPRNRQRLRELCRAVGASALRIGPLSQTVTLVGMAVPVDVIFDRLPSSGLSFNALRARASQVDVGTEKATVVSLEDVVESKEAAGRAKDLAQLPVLRQALKVRRALVDLED